MKPLAAIVLSAVAIALFAVLANVLEPAPGQSPIDPLGNTFEPISPDILATGTGLGVLLLGGWLLGKAAQRIGLSKITGYLVFGILSGPAVGAAITGNNTTWILTKGQVDNLTLVNELAIALIALTAGGEIRLDFLKEAFAKISAVLALEFTLVLAAVTALMSVLLSGNEVFAEYGGTTTVILVALVVGIVATANSPAVVIAIIGESNADGPMSRLALSVTVCKDLLLIIAFAIALAVATNAAATAKERAAQDDTPIPAAQELLQEESQPTNNSTQPPGADATNQTTNESDEDTDALLDADDTQTDQPDQLAKKPSVTVALTKQLGGSMIAGIGLGLALAWYVAKVNARLPVVLVLGSFAVALIAEQLGLKTLIVGLSAGLTMANLYPKQAHDLFDHVEELSVPVYAIFFAVAGTKVDPKLLADVWVFVVLYVILRAAAVWAGTGLGCKIANVEPPASRWLWTAFVPQAGISLALAVVVADQFSEFAFSEKVFGILISAIAINELLGPILFKFGINKAGENVTTTPKSASNPDATTPRTPPDNTTTTEETL